MSDEKKKSFMEELIEAEEKSKTYLQNVSIFEWRALCLHDNRQYKAINVKVRVEPKDYFKFESDIPRKYSAKFPINSQEAQKYNEIKHPKFDYETGQLLMQPSDDKSDLVIGSQLIQHSAALNLIESIAKAALIGRAEKLGAEVIISLSSENGLRDECYPSPYILSGIALVPFGDEDKQDYSDIGGKFMDLHKGLREKEKKGEAA